MSEKSHGKKDLWPQFVDNIKTCNIGMKGKKKYNNSNIEGNYHANPHLLIPNGRQLWWGGGGGGEVIGSRAVQFLCPSEEVSNQHDMT